MSDVTRSMEATSAVAAAAVERRRRAMPNGWWGALLFIATELTLFGALIASYFYLRVQNTHWPPPGVDKPKVALPLLLTGILVATVAPVLASQRAARSGRARLAWWLLAEAFVVQAAYLGVQFHEFASDLDKFSPSDSAYGSIYFTLLGVHHAHVALGLLLEVWLLARLLGGMTNYRLIALKVNALYWSFVALIGIAVVFTQIYPSL